MQRTWQTLALAALIAGARPAVAGDAEKTSDQRPTKADMPSIAKKLDEIQKSLKSLEDYVLAELPKIRDRARDLNSKVTQAQSDMAELQKQIAQLQQNLDALNKRVGNVQTQTSGYAGLPAQPAATGRIRLVNTFPQTMTIRINTAAYELPPGQERYVEGVPAGTFTYEVLGVSASAARSLAPGETYAITVYPR